MYHVYQVYKCIGKIVTSGQLKSAIPQPNKAQFAIRRPLQPAFVIASCKKASKKS